MSLNSKSDFETGLAKWLTNLREEKGLSQESLAVQLGKGQSDIAKIENGSKKVTVIELLSWLAALNIPLEKLEEGIRPIYDQLVNRKTL